jgi:hypothetical protein
MQRAGSLGPWANEGFQDEGVDEADFPLASSTKEDDTMTVLIR